MYLRPVLLTLTSILIFTNSLTAQLSSLKINSTMMYMAEKKKYFNGIILEGSTYSYDYLSVGNPTISLGFHSKNNSYHQVDFWPFSIRVYSGLLVDTTAGFEQIIEGGTELDISGMCRYSYRVLSPNLKNAKIKPYLDIGAILYYSYSSFKPSVSLSYPYNKTEISIGPVIDPGIAFDLGERFYIDFNIPFVVAETFITRNKCDHPTLEEKLRTTSTLSIFTFRRWTAQVGVGIYL